MPDSSRETSSSAPELMGELQDVTCNLRNALERFRFDAHLNDLAEKEIPDARARLSHVLKLTDEAAHRTLDLVEEARPLAERTGRQAAELTGAWNRFYERQMSAEEFRLLVKRMNEFLRLARADSNTVCVNLAEIRLAQGYQDLVGQIIRSVTTLVADVEKSLAELTRLARGEPHTPSPPVSQEAHSAGPSVPGVDPQNAVVTGQKEVDALLSNLGV